MPALILSTKSQAADGLLTPGSIILEHQVRQPRAKRRVRRGVSLVLKCVFSVLCAVLISIQKSAVDQSGKQVIAAVSTSREAPAAEPTHSTALGEHKIIAMADGSDLQLNTSSLASVEMNTRSRAVAIHHGEALLNIAADPRPFVIHLDSIDFETTEAVRAHVRLDPDGTTQVDMLEGEGWVSPAGATGQTAMVLGRSPPSLPARPLPGSTFQPLRVKAGSSFFLRYDVRIVEQFDPDEMSRKLAWTQGQVVLAGESLRDAVAEFNRYNRRQLVIGDESIASLPTGGTFYVTELDTFTRSLNQLFGIRAIRASPSSTAAAKDAVMLVGDNYSGL